MGTVRIGLPIASVGEVVSDMTLTRLPHASKGLLGVVNLRGEILPAASLQPWFGDAAATAAGNLFLVVRGTTNSIALRIDRFEQVVPVPEDGIRPDDEPGPRAEIAPQLWRRPVGDVHCLSADALFDALRMKKTQPEETPSHEQTHRPFPRAAGRADARVGPDLAAEHFSRHRSTGHRQRD